MDPVQVGDDPIDTHISNLNIGVPTMHVEITRSLFKHITKGTEPHTRLLLELACKQVYSVRGVEVISIYNYVSEVRQYYIQDINA